MNKCSLSSLQCHCGDKYFVLAYSLFPFPPPTAAIWIYVYNLVENKLINFTGPICSCLKTFCRTPLPLERQAVWRLDMLPTGFFPTFLPPDSLPRKWFILSL